jgi:hypothetical protein
MKCPNSWRRTSMERLKTKYNVPMGVLIDLNIRGANVGKKT